MKSELAWPRFLRDVVIILLIAAALMVALSVGILHGAELAPVAFAGAGGRVGYTSPEVGDGATEVGVHVDLAEPGTRLRFQPNLLYWRSEELRDVNPNLDVAYRVGHSPSVSPYFGAGLGLNFVDDERPGGSSTDAGMNLLGGVRFAGEGHDLFVEARHTMSDVSRTAVTAGITFGPGR